MMASRFKISTKLINNALHSQTLAVFQISDLLMLFDIIPWNND
jgi:hypothetical protein